MQWISFRRPDDDSCGVGCLMERSAGLEAVDLAAVDPRLPRSLRGLLELGGSTLADSAARAPSTPLADLRLLPPVPNPPKILGVGRNDADHAAETGAQVGSEPVSFNKLTTALRASGDPIEQPPES